MYRKFLSKTHRERISLAMQRRTLSKKHRENLSLALQGKNNPFYGKTHTPETIKKLRIANGGENNPMYGKFHAEKTKEKISEVKQRENNPMYGKFHAEKTKEKMSLATQGENHYNWQGGISYEPYGFDFTKKLKENILFRDNYTCQSPNCKSIEDLVVHHIDYDKKNNDENNLITLCRSCNSKANSNRKYHTLQYIKIQLYSFLERFSKAADTLVITAGVK